MTTRYRLRLLASHTVAAVIGAALGYFWPATVPPTGAQLDEVTGCAALDGLFVKGAGTSRWISDRKLTGDDFARLNVSQAGQTPAWKGVVWIGRRADLADAPQPGPTVRVWGPLVATGDPDLLDRLESLR